jgi:hypothetical protein
MFWYCSNHASQMEKRQTYVPPSVRRSVFRRESVLSLSGEASLARGLRLPLLWYLQGLASEAKSRNLGMRRLRAADIRDGRHGDA